MKRAMSKRGAGRPQKNQSLFAGSPAPSVVGIVDSPEALKAARRLNTGKFVWGDARLSPRLPMNAAQLSALALGLPWQRMGDAGVITVL